MEKEKLIKKLKEQAELMTKDLKFNEVHIESYTNSRGKIRYKGKIRVYETEFTFTDLSIYEVGNVFDGILIGFAFALNQIDYETKK